MSHLSGYDDIEWITFDCYGTLIDWETGILCCLQPFFASNGVEISPQQLLEEYGRFEADLEAGEYLPYRHVLDRVFARLCDEHSISIQPGSDHLLSDSLQNWPAFPDSADALQRLQSRFKLMVVSNVDDDLFAASATKLGVKFDGLVTAAQAHAYKPSLRMFEMAIDRSGGDSRRILHAAQSLYHDIAPASVLGLRTVWVDRRHGHEGTGATPSCVATPEMRVRSMEELAERLLAQ